MTQQDYLEQINQLLPVLQSAPLVDLLNKQIADHTRDLIAQNNDETRGRIKALLDLLDLPVTLQQEREGLTAALSDEDAASN